MLSETERRQQRRQQRIKLRRFIRSLFAVILLEAAVIIFLLARGCTGADTHEVEQQTVPTAPTAPTVEASAPFEIRSVALEVNAESANEEPTTETEEPEAESAGYLHSEEIPLSFELQEVMQQACEEYGVPYSLALAIAERESTFNVAADNGLCYGIMQINGINYERLRGLGIEPTEPEGNIVAGVFMIGELLDKYGDTNKALMAYNCGEGGASRLWKQGYSSSEYSRQVISLAEKWQQIIEA